MRVGILEPQLTSSWRGTWLSTGTVLPFALSSYHINNVFPSLPLFQMVAVEEIFLLACFHLTSY
jgi:hypothetical protein